MPPNYTTSRAWLATIKNPEESGYVGSPLAVCEMLKSEWIADHPTRSGVWLFCVASDGNPHVHMLLIDRCGLDESHIAEVVSADTVMPFSYSRLIQHDLELFVQVMLATETVLIALYS